jgi:uncharacterized membrane protein YhaH (DUF805 family)
MYNLFFKKLFSLNGRSNRKEYIARLLLTTLVFVAGSYTVNEINNINIFALLYLAVIFISSTVLMLQYFPLSVRRLHDLNTSGWYVFLTFVPFCQVFILWLMCKEGTEGTNNYGKEPKY